jgi:hypothetical protein
MRRMLFFPKSVAGEMGGADVVNVQRTQRRTLR